MKKFLSSLPFVFVLFAFLSSSFSLEIRADRVILRSAPSMDSKILKTYRMTAVLDVLCQYKGWSQVTGTTDQSRAANPVWTFLYGGKQIKGVPACNGTEPYRYRKIPKLPPKEWACILRDPHMIGAPGAPCNVTANGKSIAYAARNIVRHSQSFIYSQDSSRWSGIAQRACPYSKTPIFADSSSFVTWLYWTAFGGKRDFLHNKDWKDGSIHSLRSNGVSVPLAEARDGDLVFYDRPTENDHVAIYVGNNQVVSFEKNGPAKLVPIDYRRDFSIRSYLPKEEGRIRSINKKR